MRFFPAALSLLALLPAMTFAQDTVRPVMPMVKLDQPPAVDGEVIEDPTWRTIAPGSGFIQKTPDQGLPASQRTEVRLAYTDEAIYVAFTCFDDEPGEIVVSDARRDGDLGETDSVRFVFDTYRDTQNGFVFGTNPAGLEYDGQLTKGDSGGSMAGGGLNLNWDGVWEVKTQLGDFGWSAEFRIPLTTLRYPSKDVQDWGANFERRILRRHEVSFWSPLERQFSIARLTDAGTLTGLQVQRRRNLKIVPYALGEVRDSGDEGSSTDSEFGLDIKYGVTPSLTLDLTYNTDFAQVEADEVQISLDRFNLFFPEKRPFFLENAGLFTVGRSQQVELFFSRRIGLSDDGDIVPIDYGARLSGGLGGVNVGVMYMQTDDLPGVVSETTFGVARLNKELPNRSSIGAVVVDKAVPGNALPGETDNRTWGVDGKWGIGDYAEVYGYLARTISEFPDQPALAGRIRENGFAACGWKNLTGGIVAVHTAIR